MMHGPINIGLVQLYLMMCVEPENNDNFFCNKVINETQHKT